MQGEFIDRLNEIAQVIWQTGLISLLMPLIVATVVRSDWSRTAKEITVIITCSIAGLITVLATGQDVSNLAIVIPVMVALTREFYGRYWKSTGIAGWLEDLTTPKKEQSNVVPGA